MPTFSRFSRAQDRSGYTMLTSKNEDVVRVVDDDSVQPIYEPTIPTGTNDDDEPDQPWKKQIAHDLKLSRHRNV